MTFNLLFREKPYLQPTKVFIACSLNERNQINTLFGIDYKNKIHVNIYSTLYSQSKEDIYNRFGAMLFYKFQKNGHLNQLPHF